MLLKNLSKPLLIILCDGFIYLYPMTYLGYFLFLFTAVSSTSCAFSGSEKTIRSAVPPSHVIWDNLLEKHVDDEGFVNYMGFVQDSLLLNQYLETLSLNPPSTNKWTRQEQMAFWINAYNAFTVKLVADNYPVQSIKDIGPMIRIPFVSTVWDIKFIRVGREKLNLNNIEHSKLRKAFGDPRIHAAVVCASYSCPRLLNAAYTADHLDAQLDMMMRDFLADERKNRLSTSKLQLSKIFSWYNRDFVQEDINTIQQYVSQYTDVPIDPDAEIEWLEYNWSLNGIAAPGNK